MARKLEHRKTLDKVHGCVEQTWREDLTQPLSGLGCYSLEDHLSQLTPLQARKKTGRSKRAMGLLVSKEQRYVLM